MKFETGQTSEPTSANISIVSRSSKRGPTCVAFVCTAHPTMLRRRTRTTNKEQRGMYGIVGICVPESFVFSSKDPTCCDLLRAFAHIAQQETTMLDSREDS